MSVIDTQIALATMTARRHFLRYFLRTNVTKSTETFPLIEGTALESGPELGTDIGALKGAGLPISTLGNHTTAPHSGPFKEEA